MRHCLKQYFLLFEREVFEYSGRIFAWQCPEHDDLVVNAQVCEDSCQIAGVTIANHIPEAGIVACPDSRGEFVGGPSNLSNNVERSVALGSCEFLFHLSQSRTNDV